MNFNSLLLGAQETNELEALFLRENLIVGMSGEHDGLTTIADRRAEAFSQRISQKTKLLRLLLLFDKFDSTALSELDLSFLVQNELICKGSELYKNGILSSYGCSFDGMLDISLKFKMEVINSIKDLIIDIDQELGINMIMSAITYKDLAMLCDFSMKQKLSQFLDIIWSYIKNETFIDGMYIYVDDISYSKEIVEKWVSAKSICLFESVYDRINKHSDLMQYVNIENIVSDSLFKKYKFCYEKGLNSEYLLVTDPSIIYRYNQRDFFSEESLMKHQSMFGIYHSENKGMPLFDRSVQVKNSITNTPKLVDDIYYIVNIRLSDKINNLPTPSSIKELIRMRKRPEIISYRKVFSDWCKCMLDGDHLAIKEIQKDFEIAEKFLIKHRLRENKKTSLINCFFESIGGQIPYLSNVLGFFNPFITRKSIQNKRKHEWFLLTR